MTDQSNENSYKDAQREYGETEQKWKAARKQCSAARARANWWKRLAMQPTPKISQGFILAAPFIYLKFRADSVCDSCDRLLIGLDEKCEELLKATKRQANQAHKKSGD